jgi:hypothetical protein
MWRLRAPGNAVLARQPTYAKPQTQLESKGSSRNVMLESRGRSLLALVVVALALILGPQIPVFGQTAGTESITGTVKDVSGALVPGARVTVTNVDTGASRTLETTHAGLYSAPYLQPNTYEIQVSKAGFAPVVWKKDCQATARRKPRARSGHC